MQSVILSILILAVGIEDGEWNDRKHADPKIVAYALASPDRTWQFIIAPDSRYAERRAVAVDAGKVLDWSYLKRIDAAGLELTLHSGAYAPESPKQSSEGPLGPPEDPGRNVTIVGHVWTIPAKRVPYPATFEQRSEAPWPWQAGYAVRDAWRSVFVHEKMETFLPFVASLPCESETDAAFFRKVTSQMADVRRERMPVEIIGAWRNLILRTDRRHGNALLPYMNTWALRFDDRDAWLYAHVMILDRVDAGDVYGAAFYLDHLRKRINEVPGRDLAGPIPYTAVLAIGRHTISDQSTDRYGPIMAGLSIARALGESYLPADNRLTPSVAADQPELMRRFAAWFAPREKAIAAAAATETEALEAARKTLAGIRKCATGERLSRL